MAYGTWNTKWYCALHRSKVKSNQSEWPAQQWTAYFRERPAPCVFRQKICFLFLLFDEQSFYLLNVSFMSWQVYVFSGIFLIVQRTLRSNPFIVVPCDMERCTIVNNLIFDRKQLVILTNDIFKRSIQSFMITKNKLNSKAELTKFVNRKRTTFTTTVVESVFFFLLLFFVIIVFSVHGVCIGKLKCMLNWHLILWNAFD